MITYATPQQLGPSSFLIIWTSDQVSPTFRVYVDGVLVSTQTGQSFTLTVLEGESPVIEVLDVDTDVPQIAHPAYFILGWQRDDDAAEYLIEQYSTEVPLLNNDGDPILNDDGDPILVEDFVELATIRVDPVVSWMTYVTAALADVTVHTFRLTPYDSAGNAGTPTVHVALMVRNPDVPNVTLTYSAGTTKITIAAA